MTIANMYCALTLCWAIWCCRLCWGWVLAPVTFSCESLVMELNHSEPRFSHLQDGNNNNITSRTAVRIRRLSTWYVHKIVPKAWTTPPKNTPKPALSMYKWGKLMHRKFQEIIQGHYIKKAGGRERRKIHISNSLVIDKNTTFGASFSTYHHNRVNECPRTHLFYRYYYMLK